MSTKVAGTTEPAGAAWRPAPVRSSIVAAGDGRTPAPLNIVGEETLVKVSAEDSDGTLAFFHLVAPPMSGPPRHVHSREDELFYVLEGELVFELDGERHTVRAGDISSTLWQRSTASRRWGHRWSSEPVSSDWTRRRFGALFDTITSAYNSHDESPYARRERLAFNHRQRRLYAQNLLADRRRIVRRVCEEGGWRS